MILRERRKHFFINKSLQLRYMLTIVVILLVVIGVSLVNLYFGIWGEILGAFSNEKIRNDLLLASRIQEYEEARAPVSPPGDSLSPLTFMRRAEKLSERQREVFKDILNQTNRNLIGKLFLLFALIAWGSIFLSHKIAGPLYRFQRIFEGMARGDLSARCHLRKFDEAKSVAESFNQALESLDSSLTRCQTILKDQSRNPDQLVDRLRGELDRFKTSTSLDKPSD